MAGFRFAFRALVAAAVVWGMVPTLPPSKAQAQAIDRYSPEFMWLNSAMPIIAGYIDMLLPLYKVAGAVGGDYDSHETFAKEVRFSVGAARDEITMIHENNVWLLELIPEPPPYKRGPAGDLIQRIGDLRAHSEDIRLMSETVLKNLEASVDDVDLIAYDNGLLETAALMRHLSSFSQYREDFARMADFDNHPLVMHIHAAERATTDSLFSLRQMEVLAHLSYRAPEYQSTLSELIASIGAMRRESQIAARKLEEHLRYLNQQGGAAPDFEKNLTRESLETEGARADLIRELELAVFYFSSAETQPDDIPHQMMEVYDKVVLLEPFERKHPQKRPPRPERQVDADLVR